MPTYINAYEILKQVRHDLNEMSDAYVQETDISGAFRNDQLMAKINQAQRIIWNFLFNILPEIFLASRSIIFSSSLVSLPADFYRMKRLEDENGVRIDPISTDERHIYNGGSRWLYYRYGNTLRLDKDDISDTYTLWYYTRPRELDCGKSAAGATQSVTLAATAKKIVDYYKGMMIENITDDAIDAIVAYTAERVCAVSNTWAIDRYYGIVSELPEAFHHIIQSKSTIICKSLIKSPEKPTAAELTDFIEMLRETIRGYAGTQFTDVSMEDIIYHF